MVKINLTNLRELQKVKVPPPGNQFIIQDFTRVIMSKFLYENKRKGMDLIQGYLAREITPLQFSTLYCDNFYETNPTLATEFEDQLNNELSNLLFLTMSDEALLLEHYFRFIYQECLNYQIEEPKLVTYEHSKNSFRNMIKLIHNKINLRI